MFSFLTFLRMKHFTMTITSLCFTEDDKIESVVCLGESRLLLDHLDEQFSIGVVAAYNLFVELPYTCAR